MLRNVVGKALWVAKGMALFWGAVMTLALVFGLASVALAGNGVGDVFNLGRQNIANGQSALLGDTARPNLRIVNQGNQPALALRVGNRGTPPAQKTVRPMKVDSQARVGNLNADLLDGNSAGAFLGSDAVIRTENNDLANGTESSSASAQCQDGEVATGGGAALVLDGAEQGAPPENGEFVIAASRPTSQGGNPGGQPDGWQASILDSDSDAAGNGLFTLRVYAVCTNVGAAVAPQ